MAGLFIRTSVLRRLGSLGALAALLLAVSACSMLSSSPSLQSGESFLGVITPYRMDIVQGNVVTQEQAALIKPGMSRDQVRNILGSPMLTDVFHADRWDYVFTIRRQGTAPQRRDVVAHFKDDQLERLDAQDLPTEHEFVAAISRPITVSGKPMIELSDEQIKALPKPPKAEPAPSLPMGAVRSYPPLEPS